METVETLNRLIGWRGSWTGKPCSSSTTFSLPLAANAPGPDALNRGRSDLQLNRLDFGYEAAAIVG